METRSVIEPGYIYINTFSPGFRLLVVTAPSRLLIRCLLLINENSYYKTVFINRIPCFYFPHIGARACY